MNIQELPIKEEKNQKNESYYAYQPCEVTVLSVDPQPNVGKFQTYQSITVLGQHGVAVPASWSYPVNQPDGAFNPANVGKPQQAEVQVKPDQSKYAVNGLKYTVRAPKPQGSGFRKGGGGGFGRPAETPQEKAYRNSSILLSYYLNHVHEKPKDVDLGSADIFIRYWMNKLDEISKDFVAEQGQDNPPI